MAIPKPEPRDWQLANAQVLQVTDREVLAVLRNAKKNVDKILAELPAGAEIRRAQLEQSRARLLAEQSALFERLGDVVSARRAAAASRSARLSAASDAALLRKVGKSAEAQFLYDSALETSQRAIDTALARLKLSALPLSQRIYKTSVWMNGRLSKMISETLATGLNAREFAKKARDWFNPNTPGGVRFAAMRLARTEINNAFHAMSAEKYAQTPWVTQVDWNLSKSHPKPDICNEVHADSPFDKDKVPARPHPQCMCYITPTTVDEDEFVDRFINGEYDDYLDSELAANGWDVKESAPEPKTASSAAGSSAAVPEQRVTVPTPTAKDPSLPPTVKSDRKTTPSGKKPKPLESISDFIPEPAASDRKLQAQIARQLRAGKSTEEIRLDLGPKYGNNVVLARTDQVLKAHSVPAHLVTRTGTPGSTRDATTVRPTTPVTQWEGKKRVDKPIVVPQNGPKVEAPAVRSRLVKEMSGRISDEMTSTLRQRIERVVAIQETHLGDQVKRRVMAFGYSTELKDNKKYRDTVPFANGIHIKGTVFINPHLESKEERLRQERHEQLHGGNKTHCGHDGVEATVAHEMGHAFLTPYEMTPIQRRDFAEQVEEILDLPVSLDDVAHGREITWKVLDEWIQTDDNKKIIAKNVSQYGSKNCSEMIAEIWADYTMNPNPSSIIQSLGELVKGYALKRPMRIQKFDPNREA